MKKILFPTDFSPTANNAFVYSLAMANKIDAEIIAMHVYNMPDIKRMKKLPSTLTEVYNDIEFEEFENFRDAIPILREIAQKQNRTNVKLSHMLVKGESIPCIARVAQKEDVDYVIMGTKGAGKLKEMVMGSTTSGVIQKVKKIIISVPEQAEFDGLIDDIVFLTNFKPEDTKAINDLIDFARPFPNFRIHCLHIDPVGKDPEGKAMEAWKADLKLDYPHISYHSLESDNSATALEGFCEKNNIDFVTLLPRKRTWIQRLLGSSFSLKMAHRLKVPLMTLSHYS
ncbi:MAG: universal stress protein [Saprospiraceae bacterium]|nr:universal stress protein [Saprospiraceae bacterium]